MRNLLFVLFFLAFSSCSSFFKENKILIYTSDTTLSEQIQAKINTTAGNAKSVDLSADLAQVHEDNLKQYTTVVFAGKSNHKLTQDQQSHLERFCQAGGTIVLINTKLESEYGWPWFDKFISLEPSGHGGQYDYDGGRIIEIDSKEIADLDEEFEAISKARQLDYHNSTTLLKPASSRYVQVVLDDKIDEPMEMDITHDGRVIFTERLGLAKIYLPKENKTKVLAKFDVRTEGNYEDGLQGVALDPGHKTNGWVYFYYSVPNTNIQRLSRFFLSYDSLLLQSERKIIDVEVQIETCCHSGGSVEFGPDGLLYLSTGDNTSSKESNGYSPIDERPGRGPFDAQKSSGNTNDLRGKILRIKVNNDGSYDIPDGNLFPKDGSQGRPEVYVMGARNPFRISIDAKRNHLYWGDVGPDSGKDGIQGAQSYDEFNRAKEAGNYGWPYFQANNIAYPDWDFVTDAPGDFFNPSKPLNESPNNTGARELPPAQPALIFYPYSTSEIWPVLGKGSRSAMGGPVYYSDMYAYSGKNFPSYYDGKWFIYEWSRSWVSVVTFDDNGDVYDIEPFLPNFKMSKPIDIEFGPDGAMYLLEYGSNYFANNEDAKLSRIEFAEGNRNPVAVLELDKSVGAAPLTVNFSGLSSYDHDKNDQLEFEWEFSDGNKATGDNVAFTFDQPGVYHPKLIVRDQEGATSIAERTITVGNAPPEIDIKFQGNKSFYFGHNSVKYRIEVSDKEDGTLSNGTISNQDVAMQFHYIPQGKDLAVLGEKNMAFNPFMKGKNMIEESDCKSCHDMDKTSIGPSYTAIAERYSSSTEEIKQLGQKVIDGGNGVWGHSLMAAHPQHSLAETQEMVKYILSLDEDSNSSLGLTAASGELMFDKHPLDNEQASYILTVKYKDKGANDMPSLTRQKNLIIRNPRLQAEDYDDYHNVTRVRARAGVFSYIQGVKSGSYIKFSEIDLTELRTVTYNLRTMKQGTQASLRIDSPNGLTISEVELPDQKSDKSYRQILTTIKPTEGVHDLFIFFENEDIDKQLLQLDWIELGK